ncbi:MULTISPECIES: polyprenyl synthetase family protein [Croceitalea]|uniref:Polyprenyl synthetase family protein n=1 Tax=Croceitalea vernalis TaxID=3075599 RepID=A0ABU3BEX9_9FLAO|nr:MULTISPECIES: polyprenyl synthetase family protein [unclassified Croceitalea]MDT0538932.1 polyprenyl synthetase family protein [Croceitalea sp. P059]MDT0620719.1 polyprenyl synthetase family protein [Croceitalea sp. P007]
MQSIEFYREEFLSHLEKNIIQKEPTNLYQPITYILNLGGKRLRPVLTLLTADLLNGNYKDALDAAMAVEVFHNFSLIHDDIMDDAPLRRGKITVHEKWDVNTGILSGDAMLIQAYQLFENYEPQVFKELLKVFSQTAIEVCEGQQYDVDFETRDDVTIPEYLKMIAYKTAVLVAAAMKMGAIVAKASIENQVLIYEFGKNLGIAFQLQDDYLDAFGDPKTFGKQVGGDIIENKKTFLYLKSLEKGTKEQQKQLLDLFSIQPKDAASKIEAIKTIFTESGAVSAAKIEIEKYTNKAFNALNNIQATEVQKKVLIAFGQDLMNRNV